jgi:alpha-ribazole phosphatase
MFYDIFSFFSCSVSPMTTLTLLRHTKPAIPTGICYGQTDIACAESFANEAEEIARYMALRTELHGAPIITSPLIRCTHLAQTLAPALGSSQVLTDARLQELHFGAWEMCAWENIPPDDLQTWMEGYMHIAPPQGETYTELYNRCGDALMDYIENMTHAEQQHGVMVTHAGCIRAMLAYCVGFHPGLSINFTIGYGSMTELHYSNGKWSIGYVNRTAHVSEVR